MTYAVDLTRTAADQLEDLPTHNEMQSRMLEAIRALGDNPGPPGSVPVEVESAERRIRVGDWRALYNINEDEKVVTVVRIAHRREAYE